MSGKKRASPGADTEKNPLESVELSDEDAHKLQDVQKQIERAELLLGGSHFAEGIETHCNLSSFQSVVVIRPFALSTKNDAKLLKRYRSFGLLR
jgi:hypothetical protein